MDGAYQIPKESFWLDQMYKWLVKYQIPPSVFREQYKKDVIDILHLERAMDEKKEKLGELSEMKQELERKFGRGSDIFG